MSDFPMAGPVNSVTSTSRRVVVTGGARGLGQEVADQLAAEGWEVWSVDRTSSSAGYGSVRSVSLDVTDPVEVKNFFAQLGGDGGGLAGLVNNAGIFPLSSWDELDLDTWNATIAVNLTGSFLCAQAAALTMRDSGTRGSIVNIASTAFYKGHATGLAYSASKGGVVGLTRTLAAAVGHLGIRVNAVAPGMMPTPGVRELVDQGDLPGDRLASDTQRVLEGQTSTSGVASVVRFLLGDDSREITGQVIAADGGTTFI